jgi:hypothetical protein
MNFNLGGTAGLTFDPISGIGYVADGYFAGTNLLYSLDTGSGTLTPIGATLFAEGMSGLAFYSVPEPSSFIFCFGSISFFVWRMNM